MRFYVSHKKGFTLYELLVVAAVISILASIVMVSLNEARKKTRDAQRISDLQQVQLALRQYKDVHGSYPFYPAGTKISVLQEDPDGDPSNGGGELKPYFSSPIVDPLDTSDPLNGNPGDIPQSNVYLYNSHMLCDDGKYRAVIMALVMEQSQNVSPASGCATDPFIFNSRPGDVVSGFSSDDAAFGTQGTEYAIILK